MVVPKKRNSRKLKRKYPKSTQKKELHQKTLDVMLVPKNNLKRKRTNKENPEIPSGNLQSIITKPKRKRRRVIHDSPQYEREIKKRNQTFKPINFKIDQDVMVVNTNVPKQSIPIPNSVSIVPPNSIPTPKPKKEKKVVVKKKREKRKSTKATKKPKKKVKKAPRGKVQYDVNDVLFKVVFSPINLEGNAKLNALKDLCSVKNVYSEMLPNMPKHYTTRLVFDPTHISLIGYIMKDGKEDIFCGITFKPIVEQGYVEIAFVAVHKRYQWKGMGSVMMNNLKKTLQCMRYYRMITCADNNAVGYFKKQGFSPQVTLEKKRYEGYIKNYEKVTLMECVIRPDIDYINFRKIVPVQKKALLKKLETFSEPIECDGIPEFIKEKKKKKKKAAEEYIGRKYKVLSLPEKIPGLRGIIESKRIEPDSKRKEIENIKKKMKMVVDAVYEARVASPFRDPVSKKDVPDYFDIIFDPMDLSTIKRKLEKNKYGGNVRDFHSDMMLIWNNCRYYNGINSEFTKYANEAQELYFKHLKNKELIDYF